MDLDSTTKLVNTLAIFDQGVVNLTGLTADASLGISIPVKISVPTLGNIAPVYVDVALAATCPNGAIPSGTAQGNTVCKPCAEGMYEKAGSCSAAPRDILCEKGSTVSWCESCPNGVTCKEGSMVSDWELKAGHWRTDDESDDVRKCRFGATSCPGDDENQASMNSPSQQRRATSSGATTGPNPHCSPNHVAPLCSACAPDFFLSWTGDGKCHQCTTKESHAPTIGLMSGVFVFVLSCLTCAYKKSLGKAHRTTIVTPKPENSLLLKAKQVYILAKFKAFTLLLTSQVRLRSQPSSLINHRHRS